MAGYLCKIRMVLSEIMKTYDFLTLWSNINLTTNMSKGSSTEKVCNFNNYTGINKMKHKWLFSKQRKSFSMFNPKKPLTQTEKRWLERRLSASFLKHLFHNIIFLNVAYFHIRQTISGKYTYLLMCLFWTFTVRIRWVIYTIKHESR